MSEPNHPKHSHRQRWSLGAVALVAVAALVLLALREDGATPVVAAPKPALALSQAQEMALGLQAVPAMAAAHGGFSSDTAMQANVNRIGQHIVAKTAAGKTGWRFSFQILADESALSVYTLPGGAVYLGPNLVNRMRTEGQLAAVIAHGIAHAVARHGARQVTALLDPQGAIPDGQGTAVADALVALKYSAAEEAEADRLTVQYMADAGYNPASYVDTLQILSNTYWDGVTVAFFTDHPSAADRVDVIKALITKQFPDGVPAVLSK